MIYFIGGKKQREFKYFELLEKIRKENVGISESFFDVDLKENEKFLEKININSIFSSQELVVLKRAEKLKNIEEILKYIANLEIVNKEIIIDYDKEDGEIWSKIKKSCWMNLVKISKWKFFISEGNRRGNTGLML